MNEFEAKNVLGGIVIPALDEVAESVEWLRRDNYTVEELECMCFVGDEKPIIKKDGVKIIRDGTVIRKHNTETGEYEFLFVPRYAKNEKKE